MAALFKYFVHKDSRPSFGVKRLLPILTAAILFQALPLFGQDIAETGDGFLTTINISGRYLEPGVIELRYFPEKRVVMETGFRDGFIIERRTENTGEFEEIARLLPYGEDEWDAAMEQAEGETLDLLDLARAFLGMAREPAGGTFDFEEGISQMRTQMANEDFEHAVFVLTAARDAMVAEALAMSYTDRDIEEGITYTYRVRTVAEPPVYNLVPQPFTIIAAADPQQYENQIYFYEGDTWINFVWEEDGKLSLFEIERSTGGNDFVLLTDAPRLNLRGESLGEPGRASFRDEGLDNYRLYTYRFYGYNIFGERVMFAQVDAMPRDRTPPEQPRVITLEHHRPDEVLIAWDMNDTPAADLMGFAVGRAKGADGEYQVIHPDLLPASTRTFIDTSFVQGQMNYYVIQAVDTAFNVSSSLPVAVTLIDTIPPAPPVWASGSIDSLGVVSLKLEKNPENDLMGYRLYRSNDPGHEFSVIFEGFVESDTLRDAIPVVFTDTVSLNSLTPYIYYRAIALDFNFNQSEFSEIMIIERPDTIPPTTPVFKRVVSSTSEIELHFALSSSHDVQAHTLYRNTNLYEPWEEYRQLDNDQLTFTDQDVQQGTTYYYSIRARDNSGLYSDFARPVQAMAYDDGVRPPVEDLSFSLEEEMGVLTWSYPVTGENVFFIVYREDERGRLTQHARTNEPYFSEPVGDGQPQAYAVKAFTSDGGESPMSRPAGGRIPE